MKLYNLLIQDMIIEDLNSTDREGTLKEMANFLKKRKKIGKEKELYEKLLQREKLGSTAIGEGVAIPHCKIKGVKSPIVLLAISKKRIDFHSLDGKPSNIFFLVVSSPDNPSLNLQILAAIASLVRKSGSLLKRVLNAQNTSTVLEIIREEEEKLSD
jgi:PTS system nitrogen regulatory IIA component